MKGSDTIIMIRDLHEIQGKSISRIAAELIMSEVFIIIPMPARRPAQIVMKTGAVGFPAFCYN
jgi:hypothetical protein